MKRQTRIYGSPTTFEEWWDRLSKDGLAVASRVVAHMAWVAAQKPYVDVDDTLHRLRSQIPGCDCENPAQCWESCGTLGHSTQHVEVIKDDASLDR